jgi:hypothetical protein
MGARLRIEDFTDVIPFPDKPYSPPYTKEVYVLFYVHEDKRIPFYVGQTKRFLSRMDDYYWAQFPASTDFKVGEAIRYLKAKGYPVVAGHLQSENPLDDEHDLIESLTLSEIKLLNVLAGYDFRSSSKDVERAKISKFCEDLVSSANFKDG